MTFGITPYSLNKLKQTLSSFPTIQKVIIYGSRAMGHHKKESDIDLAFIGTLTDIDLARIHDALEEVTPYYIDALLYNTICSPRLKHHIDTCGKLFFSQEMST